MCHVFNGFLIFGTIINLCILKQGFKKALLHLRLLLRLLILLNNLLSQLILMLLAQNINKPAQLLNLRVITSIHIPINIILINGLGYSSRYGVDLFYCQFVSLVFVLVMFQLWLFEGRDQGDGGDLGPEGVVFSFGEVLCEQGVGYQLCVVFGVAYYRYLFQLLLFYRARRASTLPLFC